MLKNIYKKIAPKYEITNHFLTFGLDFYWRKKAADIALTASTNKETKWLDLCTGTGEFAIALKNRANSNTIIYGTDFSQQMLDVAKKKSNAKGIIFQVANTYSLPFKDNSFDLISISFALRNLKTGMSDFKKVFDEIFRVLKPGGIFINVETSQPGFRIIKILFRFYSKYVISFVGGAITKSPKGFKYLASSILKFYDPKKLSHIIKQSGFKKVKYTPLTFGIVAIHTSRKQH